MNEELQKRLKELQERNRIKARKAYIENHEFLQECVEFTEGELLSDEESREILERLFSKFSQTVAGKIDFSKVRYTDKISKAEDILNLAGAIPEVYIMWDNAEVPCVKCKLENAIKFLDDVTAVSFYTWLISPNFNTAIELGRDYIKIGIL